MVQPSATEQYMLELINRARLNPTAEGNSYGISDLNDGLDPGTITSDPKQPLAFNLLLMNSARSHSQWMLDTDTFDHTGINGTSSRQRMQNAGYQFTGSWRSGENIGYKGTTGTVNLISFTEEIHENLFTSAGHRKNILRADFREIGLATTGGEFTNSSGDTFNTLMVTQNFAKSGSEIFLTGVAYDDLVLDNDFYTVGEGLAGITITAVDTSSGSSHTTTSMNAGGYQLALPAGTYDVTFSDGNGNIGGSKEITIVDRNIKLDLDTSNLPPISTQHIGEVGMISDLNHLNQTIQLNNNYTNPVIFVTPLSYNGADPSIARITDIQNDSFDVYLQEAEYKDGNHTKESLSYLVLESGTWVLEDGTVLEVGTVDTRKTSTSSEWESIDLSEDFNETPIILSQVQTNNGSQFVRTRQQNASIDGFELSLEEEEALKFSTHARESVGWLAIEPSSGSWDGLDYLAETTGIAVNHEWTDIDFGTVFDEAPNLLASISSYRGADPVGLRYSAIGSSEAQIKVEEDRSLDSEISHTKEIVDFFAIAGSGDLSAMVI